jgi:hypothetical protein
MAEWSLCSSRATGGALLVLVLELELVLALVLV